MQNENLNPEVVPPNVAAMAYNGIIRRTESPREIEYLVFSRVTAAMQAAEQPEASFVARIEAAHRNRELWQTLACDLASEDNLLPDSLRAALLGLTIWVTKETMRVLRGRGSLADLISVNHSIMRGLRPKQYSDSSDEAQ